MSKFKLIKAFAKSTPAEVSRLPVAIRPNSFSLSEISINSFIVLSWNSSKVLDLIFRTTKCLFAAAAITGLWVTAIIWRDNPK